MIDMVEIYRKLRGNYDEGDVIQVELVIPLMNKFIVNFTHVNFEEKKRYMIAVFSARGIEQIVMAGDVA
jgi:hypothetical protein